MYLLEFLGPNFLSNSQSYVFMKFTSLELLTLFLKLAKVVPKREIPSYVCRQGKNHFDSDDLHGITPVHTRSPKLMKLSSTLTKLQSFEPHVQIPPVQIFKTFNLQL